MIEVSQFKSFPQQQKRFLKIFLEFSNESAFFYKVTICILENPNFEENNFRNKALSYDATSSCFSEHFLAQSRLSYP